MNQPDTILELLDEVFPDAYCDECLSKELDIQPRQQVNQLGRRLKDLGRISRGRGICSSCKKIKTINEIIRPGAAPHPKREGRGLDEGQENDAGSAAPTTVLDIEQARTEVVGMCQSLWKENSPDAPPHSISVLINMLKNEDILPSHPANMMLTLCNLRNVHVYEGLPLGQREMTIAENALDIIQEWWSTGKQ